MQQIYSEGGNSTTSAYLFGGLYEVTLETSAARKYYSLAGQMVAMGDSGGLKYFLTDHLGSTLAMLDSAGAAIGADSGDFGQFTLLLDFYRIDLKIN